MKRKRILAMVDGQESVIHGTIRDTGEHVRGDPSDGIAEIIEEGWDDVIRIAWSLVLEVADAPLPCVGDSALTVGDPVSGFGCVDTVADLIDERW